LDQDQYLPTESMGVSMDGTGQVGTYFYTASEVEQNWPQINEKVRTKYYVIFILQKWPIKTIFYNILGVFIYKNKKGH
jgi:eukaryotic translation initiation factor 2-alpha kinase 4